MAHELARQLLAGPDVPVMGSKQTDPDREPMWLEKIAKAEYGSCEDNEELDGSEDDKPQTKPVIVLVLNDDDGFFM